MIIDDSLGCGVERIVDSGVCRVVDTKINMSKVESL